jgi:L-ascorbate metabolism protein UlaG (beta-lactamase superfamily)
MGSSAAMGVPASPGSHDAAAARTRFDQGVQVTWLGHSTVLVQLDGVRLLTDPLLRPRLLHLLRVAGPVDAEAIRELDAVLISHFHYDHLDLASLRGLGPSPRVVVPGGGGEYLRKRGFAQVDELGIGDEVPIGPVSVRATRAEHDTRRGLVGGKAVAVGYAVTGSARVYFAGDTDLFDELDGLVPDLDVALLPVAGWGPRLPAGHLDPRGAAEAARRLRPRVAVPIHWGTYRRIGLPRDEALLRAPAEEFAAHVQELAPDVEVRILPVGGSLELSPRAAGRPTEAYA